ncbi:unnamed protein product [Cunninghamella blakesleeana]
MLDNTSTKTLVPSPTSNSQLPINKKYEKSKLTIPISSINYEQQQQQQQQQQQLPYDNPIDKSMIICNKNKQKFGSIYSALGNLKSRWSKNKDLKISSPFCAVHVNHVHYNKEANEWLWGGCYPETIKMIHRDQYELLLLFIQKLYAELETSSDQIKKTNEKTNPLTQEQATTKVLLSCIKKNPSSVYQSFCHIGEGASGVVFKGQNREGKNVAIKRIRLYNHPRHDLLLNEVMIAKKPKSHPNIVQHLESYLWSKSIWMVMEYMDGGNLTDVVSFRSLFETEIAVISQEVLKGLQYLHSNGIIHRDIKSDNILINLNGQVKLSDFGFSAKLNSHRSKRKTRAGTQCWMAPEIACGESYGCKIDIWSFGITVIEMIEKKPPYIEEPERAAYMLSLRKRPHLDHPEKITIGLTYFLNSCLEVNPKKRADANFLLSHSFLASACSTDVLIPLIHSTLNDSSSFS